MQQRHKEERERVLDKPKKSVRRRTAGVTIDEVAALAGVSPMTVSRVINQSPFVRQDTRERVNAVIKELGFTPDPQSGTGQTGGATSASRFGGNCVGDIVKTGVSSEGELRRPCFTFPV